VEELEEEDGRDKYKTQFTLSKAASAFLEVAFKSRLDNSTRRVKIKKFGVSESHWTRCPKLDSIVTMNISKEAEKSDRVASCLQQYWLDAVGPLVMVLDRA